MNRSVKIILVAVVLVGALVFVAFRFIVPVVFAPHAEISLSSVTDDSFLSVDVHGKEFCAEGASSQIKKERGLAKYSNKQFGTKDAMVFVFSRPQKLSFWMKDMQFDIDLLWIADSEVVGVEHGLLHPAAGVDDSQLKRYSSPMPVDAVLEVRAGSADEIQIGDSVNFGAPCVKALSL